MLGPAWNSGSVDIALFGIGHRNISRTPSHVLTTSAEEPPPDARLHQT